MPKTPPPIEIDAESARDVVADGIAAARVEASAALQRLADAGRVIGVLGEVTQEIWRARELHGKQDDMAFGTGPDADLLNDGRDNSWRSLFHADSNADFADFARARCQALSRAGEPTWESVLTEEFAEAMAEDDPAALRAELVQVAAMAVSWITIIDEQS